MVIRNYCIFILFCAVLQALRLTLLYDFSDASVDNSLHYLAFPTRQALPDWIKFSLSERQLTRIYP